MRVYKDFCRYNKRHHTGYMVKWVLEEDSFFDYSDKDDL